MLTVTFAGLRARWRRLLLSALAVGLGVAFTAGTLIYTDTVNAAYYSQFAAAAKNVDAVVQPEQGATLPLPYLRAVRAVPGVDAADGRLQNSLPIVGANGRAYAGTAIDLPADPRFRSYTVVTGGGTVLLDSVTAALDHVTAGTPITVIDHDGHSRRLVVTGIVDITDSRPGAVLILPAATVASLTGADGYQRIEVAATPGVSQSALAARLALLRLPHTTVQTGAQFAAALAEQNAGGEGLLSTGLLIFSVVSLIVAVLVIYNSFRILLAQRLREVALLRCVGATRRQVMAGILAESVAMGLVASVAGVGAAVLLVAALNSGSVSLTPVTVALALSIGVAVTTGAALLPAAAASRTAPVAALQAPHEGKVRGATARIVTAVLLTASGLALTGARRNPARTAITTAALTIGIGLMTLFSVVLSTASQFATHEANSHFPADYLLSVNQGGIPPSVLISLRASSRISEAAGIRQVTVRLGGSEQQVMAVEPSAYGSMFMPEVASGSLSGVENGTSAIALNGAVASDLGLAAGGRISVDGRSLRVVATFSDGVLGENALISWEEFTRIFGPGNATEVLVKARPEVSSTTSAVAVDAAITNYPLIDVTSEASLRAHTLSSVNKLSDLLDGLLAISIVIALAGMANTLSLSVLERTRESALLRALGLTRNQLRWTISMEAALLGVMGAVAGVAFGAGFGWATGRAFLRGDGGPVSYPIAEITGYIALAGVAALLASVIPARRAARLSVIDGLTQ